MGWVIDDHVKNTVKERHRGIISNQVGTMSRVDIHARHRSLTAMPKATAIDSRIKNPAWLSTGIELEHPLEEF